jgi:hypothetical protein
MAYDIKFGDGVVNELDALRAFDSKRIVSEIGDQLVHDPLTPSKNRKCLDDVEPEFEHRPPVWELRLANIACFTT